MDSDIKGLTSQEAEKLLSTYGQNVLPEKPPPSNVKILLSQFKSSLVYILLLAGIITFVLGHYTDTLVIALAVLLNTVLGFFQERRASKALYALKALINPQALVLRDGKRTKIGVRDIVVGDVCIIKNGDKIPADGKVFSANRLFVSEAILTGESLPVAKHSDASVYMGTIVSSGNGFMVVEKTGKDTEIGKIALEVQEPYEDTPLKRQIVKFSKQLTVLVLVLTTFVMMVGLITGRDILEIFTTSVALAVSAIPEGLLVGLTVVLAIGMQRILKRKGLVRNLVSAETLGGVTTLCIDKTGTLTEGRMQVTEFLGDEIEILKQALIANDMDDPLVVALWEWANKNLSNKDLGGVSVEAYLDEHQRIDSIPFSSKDRYFASLNLTTKGPTLFVNGAPEYLLDWSNLGESEKHEIKKRIEELTNQGKRLVGLAKKRMPKDLKRINETDVKSNLNWIGIVAFSDPVRSGVKEALEKIKSAQVKLIVITGDYSQTARSVLKNLEIHLDEDGVKLGSELERMSGEFLRNLLSNTGNLLFARTTPSQKLKIVQALKKNGEIVAMMGDGVNDAPALMHADIGIVVGDATDVAKESADLILIDSSFTTIVAAIEEGRGIFNNIRKIILYLMSDAFSEIIAIIGTIILKLPLPVAAAQILWINLVSDGLPHLALTVDPKAPHVMKEPPRSSGENIVTPWMKTLVVITSFYSGLAALAVFIFIYKTQNDEVLARSVAFLILGLNSLIYVFSIRTLKEPFWKENLFSNKWLILAVAGGYVLHLFPFLTETGREFLNVRVLSGVYWILAFSVSLSIFVLIEITKAVIRTRR